MRRRFYKSVLQLNEPIVVRGIEPTDMNELYTTMKVAPQGRVLIP